MRKLGENFERTWSQGLAGAALLVGLLDAPPVKAEPAVAIEPSKVAASQNKTSLDPFFSMGGAVRFGDAPIFTAKERIGGAFAIGFAYQYNPVSLGLSYEYLGLGRDASGVRYFGSVNIDRSVDTLWANVRVRLSGPKWITPFVGVGLGAAWQAADMSGVLFANYGVRGGVSFGCSSKDSMNLAMRAAAGVEVPMGTSVSFSSEAAFDAYRLSSEIIDNCAPGAGTTSTLSIRVGLVYRYDLSEGRGKPLRGTLPTHR